jgi:hypothetical protein
VSSIEHGLFARVGAGFAGDARRLAEHPWVVSAVVLELAAARAELYGDDCEERAAMDEPSARVRLDADGGRAIEDVRCE